MASPFDFTTTPITEQTTLVARYRSTEEGGGYAGKWFRVTDTSGRKYIPENAQSALTFGLSFSGSLINESTGDSTQRSWSNMRQIEFGGGWDEISVPFGSALFSIHTGANSSSHASVNSNLQRISGYPAGLVLQSTDSFLSYYANYSSTIQPIDMTGFKFDAAMFPGLIGKTSSGATLGYGILLYQSGNNQAGSGAYGVIEPLFSASEVTQSLCFSTYANGTLTTTKGFGFVGVYAQEWLNKFPTRTGSPYRTTYLG